MKNVDQSGSGKLSRRAVLAGAVGVAATTWAQQASAAPLLTLSTNGVTNYVVGVDGSAPRVIQTAAKELSLWLGRVTGAEFRIVDSATVPTANKMIVVGQRLPTRLQRRARNGRNPVVEPHAGVNSIDEFSLRVLDGDLLIVGANDAGTLHGVFWFLSRLVGIQWYAPDTTWVPPRPTLVLDDARLNSDQRPWLLHRSVLSKEASNTAWGHRNLMSMRHVPEGAAAPPDPDWAAGTLWWPGIHPGQFKEVVPDQTLWSNGQLLCMDPRTSAAALNTLVPNIQTRMAQWGDASHPFHINDAGWEPDTASASFAAAHGGALSAPVLHLVNETARTLRTHIPSARLETQAYLFAQRPPTGMAVEDNVVITFAPIFATMAHSLWSGLNATLGEGAQLDDWRKLTGEIFLWDYGYATQDMFFLCADYWSHAETLQRAAQAGTIKGYQLESSYALAGNENAALKGWLLGAVMWDSAVDVDALIHQHCVGYYGDGAGPIVYGILRDVVSDARTSSYRMGSTISTTVLTPYLNWRTVRDSQAALATAAALAAENPLYASHVRDLQMALDHWTIVHRSDYQVESELAGEPWNIDHQTYYDRQMANWAASGRQVWRYSAGSLATLQELYQIQSQRVPPMLPPELDGIAPAHYRLYEDGILARAARVYDPQASDHLAALMPGQKSWFAQLRLTDLPAEGRWKVQFSVRMELAEDADLSLRAFEVGCYPKLPGDTGPDISSVEHHPLSMFASQQYVTVTAFGDWAFESGTRYLYLTGLSNVAIRSIFVDRAWAIRIE